ncbi:MAG: phosphate ABC transporter substrate-binding protein PstS [Bifidobacteriaceae bacterium]|jgi:phosphate transport system substrate-binding protein|nr:phosphate ABC transporter substrate-binding protein PstS [Bifidobacteriaceae bacterium]
MKLSDKRKMAAWVAAAGVITACLATGCAQNEDGGGSNSTAKTTESTKPKLSGAINGGGASSQSAAQEAWRAGFQSEQPDVTVNYDPIGSGSGREQFAAGGFNFVGTDAPFSADEIKAGLKACADGSDIVEVPVYISPIVVAFNLEGIDALNLAPKTIADIFNGKIAKWNDPAIVADNPEAKLPDVAITPVHRSDKSGTTGNFTEYLAAASGGAWGHEAGEEWPAQTGEGAEKTQGVVEAVKGAVGAVGYVDAGQATGLGWAAIKVGSEWVKASAEGAAKAVTESKLEEGRAAGDVVYELNRTTDAAGAYPLMQVSYLVACEKYQDADTGAVVAAYFRYVTSEAGQQASAQNAGSAPVTGEAELSAKVSAAVDRIAS